MSNSLLQVLVSNLNLNYTDWERERMRVEARERVDQILPVFYTTVER